MAVKVGATIGSAVVDSAAAFKEPVAMALGVTGGNEGGKGPVHQRSQVLLGPGEHILPIRTQRGQVRWIQPAGHVFAGCATTRAATDRAAKTVSLSIGTGFN